uniref:Integrase, catalytic region, zinc finger, CCHC-type, peptidase aspartic, catalytic n=1 Tax=Tanacetum cinerariifolium TaxID=118510 RepID=A0A6L2KTD1_TANCI|nr:integrase, catalytic region, zinc finger, CCHC-type, peptidase aspartic, catalytic [Tanacetum cinerariifolium]GEU52821.1 integrase, catalytic region, zinc finger, CCHC-type, peptidase aspartic, catalytic [Tanacetum cinerariifolium]
MAYLSKDIQCACSDTRPPMLDRTDFALWQQWIRLYCWGKKNRVNILKSIDEGPFQMGTLRETLTEGTEGALHLGPERPRVYSDLTSEEKDRFVTVVKLNRGLRDSNYDQLYAYLKQHEVTSQGTALNLRDHRTQSTSKTKCCRCKLRRMGVTLDEEQLLFIVGGQDNAVDDDVDEQPIQDLALNVDNVFQVDDCDAFDCDVDEAPTTQIMFMANFSSAYHVMMKPVRLMIWTFYLSNMIMYDEYVKDNAVQVVQCDVSAVPNDAYMMILNDMHEPPAQHVYVTTQTKVVDKSLTAKLATYKEQVELNNREVQLDYLKYLKESVATLREIVEESKVERPLDRSVASACLYTKHSQELLEYVIGTCPKDFNKRDKKHATTPLNRKKQVTFKDQYETSNANTQKHVEQQLTQKTNVLVLPSTVVDSFTDASGSKPRSNTKKNRISPAKSVNKKTIKDHSKTNKSHFQKLNHVDSSISSKRTVINSNSDSVYKTCNKCFISANHDMCMIKYLNFVNAPSLAKNVVCKFKQVWKPKHVKQLWKATGTVLTTVGYQRKPKGRIFTLGEQCPLTRFTRPKVVPAKKPKNVSTSKSVITENSSHTSQKPLTRYQRRNKWNKAVPTGIPTPTDAAMQSAVAYANQPDFNQNWGSNFPNSPSLSVFNCKSYKSSFVRFGNDHFGAIMGYGDYEISDSVISRENLKLPSEDLVIPEEPASSTGTLSSLQNLEKNSASLISSLRRSNMKKNQGKPMLKQSNNHNSHDDNTIPPPPPPQPQQRTTDLTLMKHIDKIKQHMVNLLQYNLALEERLDKHGSWLYKLENLNIPTGDLPTIDMKEILQQRMFESKSYKAHKDHKKLYDVLEKSPPPQPPPPPPPAGASGALGTSGASGSSQLPLPPPPPSTGTSGLTQQQGSKALSLSKFVASTPYFMAWTTSDTRYESAGVSETQELSPMDSSIQDDSILDEKIHLSDDEDFENDHLPKAYSRKD